MARRPGHERRGEDPHPEPGTGRPGDRTAGQDSPRPNAVCRALGWLGRNVLLGWSTGTAAPLPPFHPDADGVFRLVGGALDPADALSVRPEPPGAPAPRAPRGPDTGRPGRHDPPPGHPERPGRGIPPSSAERALWRALDLP
jgi:hypothetical protein